MSNMTIEKIGTVTITDHGVTISGFDFTSNGGDPDMREAARTAIDWAISVLQQHKPDGVNLIATNTVYLAKD